MGRNRRMRRFSQQRGAVAYLDVVMTHVRARDDVNRQGMLIGGLSRGGFLAMAYADAHPDWSSAW